MQFVLAIILLTAINFGLLVTLCYVLIQQQRERADLYDRIMSKSIVEYKDNAEPEPNEVEEEEVEIDLADAREEIENG